MYWSKFHVGNYLYVWCSNVFSLRSFIENSMPRLSKLVPLVSLRATLPCTAEWGQRHAYQVSFGKVRWDFSFRLVRNGHGRYQFAIWLLLGITRMVKCNHKMNIFVIRRCCVLKSCSNLVLLSLWALHAWKVCFLSLISSFCEVFW